MAVNIDQMTETQLEEYFRNTLVGYDLATMRNVLNALRAIFLGDMEKVRLFLASADERINDSSTLIEEAKVFAQESIKIAESANVKSDSTQKQLELVVGASTIDPDVKAAQVDSEGNVYDSLGQRLNQKLDPAYSNTILNQRGLKYYWTSEVQPPARTDEPGYFIDLFRLTSDEYISQHFEPLRQSHPDYVTRTLLGKDQSGVYDIWSYEFTPKNYKNTIVISSGLHGGEVTLMAAMLQILKELLNAWENYQLFSNIREEVRIIYVPFANPWGVSQKDENGNPKRYRQNSRGVDLNRNFDYNWSTYKTGQPFDHDYKGTAPFSEAETQIIRDLVNKYSDAIAYIDLHNTGVTDRDYFVYLPENYPNKTYEKLTSYFTKDNDSLLVVLNRNSDPTLSNYVFYKKGIPASHPEWCDARFGRMYGSTEITKAVEWIANVIFEHYREFGLYATSKTKAFGDEDYYTYSGSGSQLIVNTGSGTANTPWNYTNYDIPEDGVVVYSGEVVALANTDTRVCVAPVVGQRGSTPSYGVFDTARFEVYADAKAGERVSLHFEAMVPVKKTDGSVVGQFGARPAFYTNGVGNFQVARYRQRLKFIPGMSHTVERLTY